MFKYNTPKNNGNSSSNARISFLIWIFIALFVLYFYNFFLKSVIEHNNIKNLAEAQYIIQKDIPSIRGNIYYTDSKTTEGYYPMALNEEKYDISVVPKNIEDKKSAASKLASSLSLDEKQLFDDINNDKLYLPAIAKRLSKEKILEILEMNIPGVLATSSEFRVYPEDHLASQVIGFVDAENIGRYGLEGYYNEELTGVGGEVVAEKDILGRFISIEKEVNAKNGFDVYTTIDRNIQYIASKYLNNAITEMGAEKGSLVIMDPKTGKILAMTSNPQFNPNNYYETAKDHPEYYTNPIISGAYEPGSIMKPIVMSMAMDLKKVEPDTKEVFGGSVIIQGYDIHNAKDRAFGEETMTKVLENSDNIAMIWVSQKMSDEEMYKYFVDFGFGQNSNIDLEGEASGSLIPTNDWHEINHATMAFGQGIATTPLQMAVAYSALANKGIMMKPYIVDKIKKNDGTYAVTEPQEVRRVISEDTSKKITDMLVSTVNNGYDIGGKIAGYKLAGKTGTAQIPKSDGGYEENLYIHSFAGYFPADDPKYVAVLILDKPKKYTFASSTCAPTFAQLAKWLLNYSEIKPN